MPSSPAAADLPIIHATCVSYRRCGVLILGPSGSGKSDLALRLIDRRQWRLVADDRTELEGDGAFLVARSPGAIRQQLEIRGVGIVTIDDEAYDEQAAVGAVLRLAGGSEQITRLPEEEFTDVEGRALPQLTVWPFEVSAPLKVERWLDKVIKDRMNQVMEDNPAGNTSA